MGSKGTSSNEILLSAMLHKLLLTWNHASVHLTLAV